MKDPYVYSGTNVLINTLNIKDPIQLEFVEKEIITVRLKDIARGLLTDGSYDINHYKQFHSYIFGDIYPWAGEFRTINIVKNEIALNGLPLEFLEHEIIYTHLDSIFSALKEYKWDSFNVDEQTNYLARIMSEIWRAHGFREGNTRTTITFFSEFAKSKGFPLRTSLFSQHSAYMRNALVASVFEDKDLGKTRNYRYLERILKDAITS